MNEWVIVGIVALIVFLFGAKKLPDLARSLGKSSSEFKKGMSEGASDPGGGRPPPDDAEKRSEGTAQTSGLTLPSSARGLGPGSSSLAILPRTPFTNRPESSVDRSLAARTASSIATPTGIPRSNASS